jgi:hypothetical protein
VHTPWNIFVGHLPSYASTRAHPYSQAIWLGLDNSRVCLRGSSTTDRRSESIMMRSASPFSNISRQIPSQLDSDGETSVGSGCTNRVGTLSWTAAGERGCREYETTRPVFTAVRRIGLDQLCGRKLFVGTGLLRVLAGLPREPWLVFSGEES